MARQTWTFQAIEFGPPGEDPIVLERCFIPRDVATRLFAREALANRLTSRSYDRRRGRQPEAVRILDDCGREVLRVTAGELPPSSAWSP